MFSLFCSFFNNVLFYSNMFFYLTILNVLTTDIIITLVKFCFHITLSTVFWHGSLIKWNTLTNVLERLKFKVWYLNGYGGNVGPSLPGPPEPRDLWAYSTHAQHKFIATAISVWLFWQDMVEKRDPDQELQGHSQPMELSWRQWTLRQLRVSMRALLVVNLKLHWNWLEYKVSCHSANSSLQQNSQFRNQKVSKTKRENEW